VSEPNRSLIPIGTAVVVDVKYIGTVKDYATNGKWVEDGESAIYLVEYDTFWGKRTKWIKGGNYALHVINPHLAGRTEPEGKSASKEGKP